MWQQIPNERIPLPASVLRGRIVAEIRGLGKRVEFDQGHTCSSVFSCGDDGV